MKINYYGLYYTVIKNRDDKENVDNQYENNYNNFDKTVIPNHKPREAILKKRNMRSHINPFNKLILYI